MWHIRLVPGGPGAPEGHEVATWVRREAPVGQAAEGSLRRWRLGADRFMVAEMRHPFEVWQAHFTPDGLLLTTGEDDKIRWWNPATGKIARDAAVLPGKGHIHASRLGRDGTTLAVGTCQDWSRVPRSTLTLPAPEIQGLHVPRLVFGTTVYAIDIHADQGLIVAGGANKHAQVFDVRTEETLGKAMVHGGSLRAVAFDPAGGRVLTSADDRTARLWDAKTGQPLSEPLAHAAPVLAVAFSPDGGTFLTASGEMLFRWDAKTHKRVGPPMRHGAFVASAAFSEDGRTILSADKGGAAWLWNAATGVSFGQPMRHEGEVVSASFSRDGRLVATASRDKSVCVWRVPVPAEGGIRRVALATQVSTGMELDDRDTPVVLDAQAWAARQRELEKPGETPSRE